MTVKKLVIFASILIILGIMVSCELENISSYVRLEKMKKVKECEYRRDTESGLLYHYLHSKDHDVKIAAIKALGRIGDPRAIPYLLEGLKDEDEDIIVEVIFALGLIGHKQVEKEIVPYLYKSTRIAVAAIESLGMMRSDLLLGNVEEMIDKAEPQILESLAYALANVGKVEAATYLRKATKYANGEAKLAVIYALYKISDIDSLSIFREALNDPDYWIRFYGAKGLGMVKSKEALHELYSHLHDSNKMVTIAILEALANIPETDIDKIRDIANSRYYDIRYQLALLLRNFDNEKSKLLLRKLLNDKSKMVVMAAIESLSKIDHEGVLKYASKNYNNKSYLKRIGIAKALGNILREESLSLLLKMEKDADIRVREQVLESLSKYSDNRVKVVYEKCIEDRDYVIRAICAENLVKYADSRHIDKYKEVLRKAIKEGNQEGQQIILKAIIELEEKVGKELLLANINSDFRVVRIMSAEILKDRFGLDVFDQIYKNPLRSSYRNVYIVEADYRASPLIYVMTNKGNIVLRLYGEEAPLHTVNMASLAKIGFYNNLRFHRVVPGFVVQGGDPRGDGWGTAGIVLPDIKQVL